MAAEHTRSDDDVIDASPASDLPGAAVVDAFDRLAALTARVTGAPLVLVSVVSGDQLLFAGQHGLHEPFFVTRQAPATSTYCQMVAQAGQPLVIDDVREGPSTLTPELDIAAYAGVPLRLEDGTLVGTLAVADHHLRDWPDDVPEALHALTPAFVAHFTLLRERADRFRMEQMLAENRIFAEGLLRAVPEFVMVINAVSGERIYTSRPTETLLGFTDAQLIEMTGSARLRDHLEALVNAEDEASLKRMHERTLSSADDEPFEVQLRLRHGDGVDHWFRLRLSVLERDESGQPAQLIGTLLDITEQKTAAALERAQHVQQLALRRMENELSRSIALDEVLEVAMDNVLRASGATDGYIGLLESDAIRVHYAIGGYSESARFFIEEGIVGRALRNRGPEMVHDTRKDPDYVPNLPRTTSVMAWPLLHRDKVLGVINLETSNPAGFQGAQTDFLRMIMSRLSTSIENAQLYALSLQQLAEKTALLERVSALEQLKTDMIRIAAHDLRNPLSTIIGYSQLLLEMRDRLSVDSAEFMQMILRSGYKMEKIIGDILSLERVQEMHQAAPRDRIILDDVIRVSVEEMLQTAISRSQTITFEPQAAPVTVLGDAPQLREAIDNLISNAIKYTPLGGTIRILMRTFDNRVFVDVSDTGIGIPEDMQARLFTPFYRAKTAETRDIEGTGLGLHLVKNIIERHDGQMHVHSVYGEGSTFGFELPIVN